MQKIPFKQLELAQRFAKNAGHAWGQLELQNHAWTEAEIALATKEKVTDDFGFEVLHPMVGRKKHLRYHAPLGWDVSPKGIVILTLNRRKGETFTPILEATVQDGVLLECKQVGKISPSAVEVKILLEGLKLLIPASDAEAALERPRFVAF